MSEYVILVWPYGFSLSWSTDDSTRQWWSGTESTKYRLTCQISTRLVHGRSYSVRFLSGTFLLILQFWAFQHQWNVNLPKSLVVCWFTTIGRSMLHLKISVGSLAAGIRPRLCNILLGWGPGFDVQYFPKVSDSIMWQLEVKIQYTNLPHRFTDWN